MLGKAYRLGRDLAAALAAVPLLKSAYRTVDFLGNAEWVWEKLRRLLGAVERPLSWTAAIPEWAIGVCLTYVFLWILVGSRGQRIQRPRVFLESRDDGRAVEPGNRQFLLVNSGELDAFNVQVNQVTLPHRVISPTVVRRLPTSAPAEVRCDVERGGGGRHDYDLSFADALAAGFRNDFRLPGPDSDRLTDGALQERVKVTYSDQHGHGYSDDFIIRFAWAIRKFEAVELCSRLTLWRRLHR
jgi:hypothetical protein